MPDIGQTVKGLDIEWDYIVFVNLLTKTNPHPAGTLNPWY